MKTILVTGIAGFIGAHVAAALIKRGEKVIGVDNFNDYYDVNLKRARVKEFLGSADIHELDLEDYENMGRIFTASRIDQVCHIGAQAGVRTSLERPFIYEGANNLGTLNLLELCRHHHVSSFVYASSSSVYGGNKKVPFSIDDRVDTPISLYAATKRYNELLAHTYHHLFGIRCTGLRFFTVYGPWGRPDMAIFKFTKSIVDGTPIDLYNNGKMKRDFTYIDDAVAGMVAALDKDYSYEILNIGNSKSVELMDFVACIEGALGKKAEKNMLPLQPGDVVETFADIEISKQRLGFTPSVDIQEGIPKFVSWYRKYYRVGSIAM